MRKMFPPGEAETAVAIVTTNCSSYLHGNYITLHNERKVFFTDMHTDL